MQCINGIIIMNYKKITKGQARKLFNAGAQIYLHTNKLSWHNNWQNPMPVKKDIDYTNIYDASNFDSVVNSYAYYNCDNERGNVVIYLIA